MTDRPAATAERSTPDVWADQPITCTDVFIAVFNIDNGVVLSTRDLAALSAAAELFERTEGWELQAETLRAFGEQGDKRGIRQDDVAELRHLFMALPNQELAKMEAEALL